MKVCKVEGCLIKMYCKGYCRTHYNRNKKYGSPTMGKCPKHCNIDKRTYSSWCSMNMRCNSDYFVSSSRYKIRGIKVCERWTGMYGYNNFVNDLGLRPLGKTLDRINNDGDYEPSNCRRATTIEQGFNRNNTIIVEGVTMNQFAKSLGAPRGTIWNMFRRGWSIDKIKQHYSK